MVSGIIFHQSAIFQLDIEMETCGEREKLSLSVFPLDLAHPKTAPDIISNNHSDFLSLIDTSKHRCWTACRRFLKTHFIQNTDRETQDQF
jgi:hypothetical protein